MESKILLSDGAKKFLSRFKKLYHVSQAPSFATIERYGLLSTSAILDLLKVGFDDRRSFESISRTASREFSSEDHGSFVINDQSTLNMAGLKRCLTDMTPREWIASLNCRVFFFPTLPNLARLAGALRARQRAKLVLEFDTSDLLRQGEQDISFASINVGYTLRKPAARGLQTFRPLSAFETITKTPVAEVTILNRVGTNTPFRIISAGI